MNKIVKFFSAALLILLLPSGQLHADGFNAIATSNGTQCWVVGSGGRIYKLPDGGHVLENHSQGTVNYNSVSCRGLNIWIAGDSSTLLMSTNFGQSFNQYSIPGSADIKSIYFADVNTGWVCTSNGKIFKSTDAGITWIQQSTAISSGLNSIKLYQSVNGAACGDNGVVLTTSNGGTNWILSSSLTNKNLLTADIYGRTIIASGRDGIVIKSANMGASWNKIDYKVPTYPDICVCMLDSLTNFSCGEGGFIRKSVDGSNTFTFQNNPYYCDLSKIYFYNNTNGWAISSNSNIILRTNNGGNTWFAPDNTQQTLSWRLKIPLNYYTTSGNVFYQSTWNKKEIFVTKTNQVYRSLDKGETWAPVGNPSPYGSVSNSFLVS
jgi:photosystem II stability/assembly factor-like uncharacterized protein